MYCTYQLFISVHKDLDIQVGKLGFYHFPAGDYVYTGSAKKNLESRVRRHLQKQKKLRWHIDYLLTHPDTEITNVNYSSKTECLVNQAIEGDIPVIGFGTSDCTAGCVSHLKKLHHY